MVEKKKTSVKSIKTTKPTKKTKPVVAKPAKSVNVSKKAKSVKPVKKVKVAKSKSVSEKKQSKTSPKTRSTRAMVLYIVSAVVLLWIVFCGVIYMLPCETVHEMGLGRFITKRANFTITSSSKKNPVDRVTLKLEIADNDPARLKGLMGRENLVKNTGMLFDFEEPGDYSMWMKDTLVPLDMVFVNNFNKVIALAPNRKPMSEDLINPCALEFERAVAKHKQPIDEDTFYDNCEEKYSRPSKQTRYVLELPAGTIKESGIRLGDILLKK